MGSRIVSWRRILLITLIVAASGAGGALFASNRTDLALLPALAAVALVFFLWADIRRKEKSIEQFFDSATSGDFSTTFDETVKDPLIRKIHARMNLLIRRTGDIRMKSEASERYYRAILQQSATGLVVLNSDNEIEVINRAAARFAGISPDSTDKRLLKIRNPYFFEQLIQMKPGENITYKDHGSESSNALLMKSIEINMADGRLKVISIENIRRELDQTELESYQRLIRVLTHEIMNSVAPLTSVSGTLQNRFFPGKSPIDPEKVDEKLIMALIQGLSTIDDQTRGMVDFVNNYRKLTRLPEPVIASFHVEGWLEKLKILITEQLENAGIRLYFTIESGVKEIHADKNLLSQVIMNLVNNAKDALMDSPGGRELKIGFFRYDPAHIYIKVCNNGVPIPEEDLEKIFIPFYTTKETGSGIGLYISRQIIHQHGGLLSVSSRPGETAFLIELPDFPDLAILRGEEA
jgi:two-component system nitrogen regulation sensor histidine kinase NtrY